MATAAFDGTGEAYAHITNDSRVKIWDVAAGACSHEYTPTGKHAAQLTCLAWGKVPASAPASATKKRKARQVHDVVAIGTAVGGVLLWDCSRGELRGTFGGESSGHTGKVNDLAMNAAGTLLYTCTEDCQITCWSVGTGTQSWHMSVGKNAASRLLVHADDDVLVTASTAIKIWDLSTRSSTRKLRGHAAEVTCMAYSPDHSFLVSASLDRFILVWHAAGDSSDPFVTLTLDSAPQMLTMRAVSDADDGLAELLAVSEAGGAAIWRFDPANPKKSAEASKASAKKGGKSSPRDVRPLAPSCQIMPGRGKARVAVHAARFDDSDGKSVVVCGGAQVLPAFMHICVRDNGGALLETVALEGKLAGGKGLLMAQEQGKGNKTKGKANMETEVQAPSAARARPLTARTHARTHARTRARKHTRMHIHIR